MSKNFLKALCALAVAFCTGLGAIPVMAQSQASTGQIAGTVTDSQQAALSKATVKAVNTQTGIERAAVTSDDGLYRIVLLPPGVYNVTVEAGGFASATVENVEVIVGRTADVNVSLGAAGVQETVMVSAGSVQVQTTRSEADAVLNQAAIDNLPINGRRFQDFVTLTPSAQVDPQRGQISLAGQRGINSNINVDGLDYNQPFFGGIRGGERSNFAPTIPQESIKEFQVVASGYTAEFGRSTGGVVNAVTKSGTNDFHGSAFYLIRPESLSRQNEFFRTLEDSINTGTSNTQREVKAAPTQHQFGGSVGGPIRNDRAFFFGAYEHQRIRRQREVFFDNLVGVTPNANTLEAFNFYKSLEQNFEETLDANVLLGRFDYTINNNNNFNIRYSFSNLEQLNAVSTGNSLSPVTNFALTNNGTEKDETHTVVGQLNSFLSTSVVNELRAQYSREERPRLANVEAPNVSNSIGRFGTVNFLPTTQYDWRVQIADSLVYSRGKHTIKFGGEYNRVYINQLFGFNQFGAFSIGGSIDQQLDQLGAGGAISRFDNTQSSVLVQIGHLEAAYSTNEIAFFAQDSWRMAPNFTLNYGLRWEGVFNPTPEANNDFVLNLVRGFRFPAGGVGDPATMPNQTDQWGPRVGFAWDPWNDSKTVIRGFGGIYYARTPGLILADPMNNFRVPPGNVSVRLPFSTTSLPVSNPLRNCRTLFCQFNLIGVNFNSFSLDNLPVITAQNVQDVAQALGLSPNPFFGASVTSVAGDFKNPRAYQWGAGIEREVYRGMTVGADFTYVHTVNLQRNRDLNIPAGTIRASDPAQRPFYGLRSGALRPISELGQVQIRESSARSLYRALTIRTKFQRSWGQVNAFYTLSKSLSNDDNERDAGGVASADPYDLIPEYNLSRLDRRHQFVASPVFYLPWDVDVSSAIRLRSGRPVDAILNADANEDLNFNDRPFSAPGVPFKRNAFRNEPLYEVDLRLQKRIALGEAPHLILSAEFFNIFNRTNIELNGTAVTQFCNPVTPDCGFGAPTNLNFLSLRDQRPGPNQGKLLLGNLPGNPFQMQLGVRLQF
jgi:hypothetical protein